MEQVKRWADNVCMCTFDLPAYLSASGFQGAGRQNPGFSQSCARTVCCFVDFGIVFVSFGLLQSFFPTILFLSPFHTTKVWSGRSYASHGALQKARDTPLPPGPHLFSSSNSGSTWRAPKTLRESPPVLSMRPYTGNLGSGVALISSVHWKSWIRCSTHIECTLESLDQV